MHGVIKILMSLKMKSQSIPTGQFVLLTGARAPKELAISFREPEFVHTNHKQGIKKNFTLGKFS